MLSVVLLGLTVLTLVAPALPLPAIGAQDGPAPSGDVIVVLKRHGRDLPAQAADRARVRVKRVYANVLSGFATTVTPAQAEVLANDPDVAHIYPEERFQAAAQIMPTGVNRIGASENPSAAIDGVDDLRVDSDVAVLDSGINGDTNDLNLAGGVNCSTSSWGYDVDVYGHGTHVAGTVGALDNDRGVVGVAPGARLWSVKVLNDGGGAFTSNLLCGLDWVVANKSTIDVVNMSIVGTGSDGTCDSSAMHLAICSVVNNSRIPVIVAAGNSGIDATRTIPATYSEVIAVSAISDFDGEPGGLWTGTSCRAGEVDDTLATYSNYGPDVDFAAPGTCIASLAAGGEVVSKSGTSMATPHVSGAAALFLAGNPLASPDEVRVWLSGISRSQSSPEGFTGDPDSTHESLVWLGGGGAVASGPYRLVASGASPNSAASTYVRDRKLATVWKTKLFRAGPPAEAWVWVDLGTPKPVGTIRWVFGEAGIADYFVIEGSNNLSNWKYITRRKGKPVGVWQEKITSQTFRYIRFRFANPNRDLYLGGLAEVQVWAPGTAYPMAGATTTPTPSPTPSPTATLPPNGNYPMYGSSRSSNSTSPKAVWDGDPGTTWQTDGLTTPGSAYVYVTIGSVLPIETIRWVYGIADIGDDLTIQVSNDKLTWTDVHVAGNAPVGEWQVASFSGLNAKYVRWWFTNPNSDPVIGGLAEVEIYGPDAYAGAAPDTSTPTATATPIVSETAVAASPEPVTTETPALVETATELPAEVASPVAGDGTEPVIEPTATQADVESPRYPVAGTSRSASSLPGTLAVDDNPDTVWRTIPGGDTGRVAILTLDLGENRDVGAVRIFPGGDGLLGRATIETSSDGVTWSFFAEPALVAADEDGWLKVRPGPDVTMPVTTRYVRVVFVGEGNPLGGIAEIEIMPPDPIRVP